MSRRGRKPSEAPFYTINSSGLTVPREVLEMAIIMKIDVEQLGGLKDELQRLQHAKIITKIPDQEWSTGNEIKLVPCGNGRVKLVLDTSFWNKAIVIDKEKLLPTWEQVVDKVSRPGRIYSLLHVFHVNYTIPLSQDSAQRLTFQTPFGWYKYTCIPLGLPSWPQTAQKLLEEGFRGLAGVEAVITDVVVYSDTFEEHMGRLEAMMQRSREIGIKFDAKKTSICVKELSLESVRKWANS